MNVKYTYLVIDEEGSVSITDRVTDDMVNACDEGVMEVICISTPVPVTYYNNKWEEVGRYSV